MGRKRQLISDEMAQRFRDDIYNIIMSRAEVGEDGYIHLPHTITIPVIDYRTGTPKMRNISVWRLSLTMNVVGGHGEEYLPEMIRVFDWEKILRMYENGNKKNVRSAGVNCLRRRSIRGAIGVRTV